MKYIPGKLKLVPIWLNVKLKINAIFFFLSHPTRHGRYSCGGQETVPGGGANKETRSLSLCILWPSCPGTSEDTQPALLKFYHPQLLPAFPCCMAVAKRPCWAEKMPCEDTLFICSRGLSPKTGFVGLVSLFFKNYTSKFLLKSIVSEYVLYSEFLWVETVPIYQMQTPNKGLTCLSLS